MRQVVLGKLTFPSVNVATKYVRERLNSIGYKTVESTDCDEYEFMMDLVSNHPRASDKVGLGIRRFTLQPNALQKNACHVTFERVDGSVDVLSWRKCSGMAIQKHIGYLLREAVSGHIGTFRQGKVCMDCGSSLNLHVHHNGLSFKQIVQRFVALNGMPVSLDCVVDVNTGVSSLKDVATSQRFAEYHNSVCDLVVVCQPCHYVRHSTTR